MMDDTVKEAVDKRLRRIAGQVGGIQRMVEQDRYCVDVLLQISAARAALGKVASTMLEAHIKTCVKVAFESDDDAQREPKIAELVKVFEKNCW